MTSPHSVGILLTDRLTSDGPPDAHSFALVDGEIVPRQGWGRSARLPLPTKNPPEGNYTSLYAPLPDGLTPEARTAIHALLMDHKARYGESSLYITDNHACHPDLLRWASTGSQPGSTVDGWSTSSDPEDYDPGALP